MPDRVWLALLGVLCLAYWAPELGASFVGPRGFNGGQWGLGVDAIARHGLLETKFGAIRGDYVYGSHPPLMLVVEWMTREALGRSNWALRLPIVLAGLSSLWLMWRLVRASGHRSDVGLMGVAVVCVTPMFLYFGPMIDTWILGLPLAAAVLVALARRQPANWHAVVAIGCAVCSWQGVILVALAAPVAVYRYGVRSALAQGAVIGAGLAYLYGEWVDARNGFELGWPFDGASLRHLLQMFGPSLLFVPAALLSRDRVVAALSIAGPIIYGVLLSEHADGHAYWFYWWLIPIALGVSASVGRLPKNGRLPAVALLSVSVAVCLPSVLTDDRRMTEDYRTVLAAVRTAHQQSIPVLGVGEGAPWLEYETGRSVFWVDEADDLPAKSLVLVANPVPGDMVCLTETLGRMEVCVAGPPRHARR